MKGTMLIQHEVARIRLINWLLERAHWDMRILLEGAHKDMRLPDRMCHLQAV